STEVTTIGKNAFKNCKKLKEVYINANNLKKVEKNAFKGVKKSTTIYLESSSTKAFNKASKKIRKSGNKAVKLVEQD
nr:leucine-rich repeat domain-containing protein [Butyrivibrio sp.]